MKYLSNAFSLQMSNDFCFTQKITLDEAKEALTPYFRYGDLERQEKYWGHGEYIVPAKLVIGHSDICTVINKQLCLDEGRSYAMNRESISLQPGDVLYVGQYIGSRLPEGATELPAGAKIEWYKVSCIRFNALERAHEFREFCHPETETGTEIQYNSILKKKMEKTFPHFCFVE